MSPSLFETSAPPACPPGARFSPLILADRLIGLAQEADRAGFRSSADRLIGLAYAVLDDDDGPARRAEAA
jgi:hypothetical protein